jgi:hypothetical protein
MSIKAASDTSSSSLAVEKKKALKESKATAVNAKKSIVSHLQ